MKSDRASVGLLWAALMESQAEIDERFALSDDARLRWENDFVQWLKSESRRLFVAVDDETVCGFATAERWGPPPIYEARSGVYVDELFVDVAYRRRGHGRSLVEAVRGWGEEIGARELRAGVLSGNEAGCAFWTDVGGIEIAKTFSLTLDGEDRSDVPSNTRIGFRL